MSKIAREGLACPGFKRTGVPCPCMLLKFKVFIKLSTTHDKVIRVHDKIKLFVSFSVLNLLR